MENSIFPTTQDWFRFSRYAQRWLNRFPEWRPDLQGGEGLQHRVQTLLHHFETHPDEAEFKKRLRQLRHKAMLEIMAHDLTGRASLNEVVYSVSALADAAVRMAVAFAHTAALGRYGAPAQGDRLLVVGMGKLGGGELNVSSDIDLVFLYGVDGETSGGPNGKKLSHAEFFTWVGRKVMNLISDITEDGFVFRVDMRLRPNGDSGPLVASVDMLEEYFLVQGREWERYAWIKSRVINPPDAAQEVDEQGAPTAHAQAIRQLRGVTRSFVYRKYLDFGAIRALRSLHQQIRAEVGKRESSQEAGAVHVKLGRGGIREIEFIAQVFQLIRGGRMPELQIRPTLLVLALCAQKGWIPSEVYDALKEAYTFWRNLEHRLQYEDDAQTHWLPADAEMRQTMAHAMGFEHASAFEAQIARHQNFVADQFDHVFGDKAQEEEAAVQADNCPPEWLSAFKDADQVKRLWQNLLDSSRYKSLPEAHRERFDRLLPALVKASSVASDPDQCWTHCSQLLEAIARRGAYLSLLDEYPKARERVTRILSASAWAAQYLIRHPILLDELLDERTLFAPPDWAQYTQELNLALDHATLPDGGPDLERQMDLTREMHHAQLFRLLAQDLEGRWTVERVSDHLSALADTTLGVVLQRAWAMVPKKHREVPRFAVIAYGKLGGKELGYASDLDIIFLYEDDDDRAPELYARLAQRFNRWLVTHTPAGVLFETDYRLRPNGEAGLMVSSMASFNAYQRREGGVGAWVWEHQALTRARFCVGDEAIGQAFEEERVRILRQARSLQALREEVLSMRKRMHEGHPNPTGLFDLKHDAGGMVDIEFIVQFIVLAHSHAHPALTANIGNIALLKKAGELGLIDAALASEVADAYRNFRALQHALRLAGQDVARVDKTMVPQDAAVTQALWKAVFGQAALAQP